MAIIRILELILFNGWYLVYFYAIQPHLLARLMAVPASPDVALGLGMAALQIVEALALWVKCPATHRRIRENRKTPASALGYFVVAISLLGHMGLVTALMSFATINALGLDLRGMPPVIPTLLALAFVMAMLTKEGVLLAFVMETNQEKLSLPTPPLNRRFPALSEYLADIVLALFSAVAYTVTWGQIAASAPFTATTFFGRLVEYFGAVLLFVMVFPATHPLSVAEAQLSQRTRGARLFSAVTFLVTMVAAITSIPAGG